MRLGPRRNDQCRDFIPAFEVPRARSWKAAKPWQWSATYIVIGCSVFQNRQARYRFMTSIGSGARLVLVVIDKIR